MMEQIGYKEKHMKNKIIYFNKEINAILIIIILFLFLICFGFSNSGSTQYYPNNTVTDQGGTTGRSVKNLVDAIGSSKNATIVLKHSSNSNTTSYLFETNETSPSNITLEIEPGAYIDGNAILTIYSPANIKAEKDQKIFANPNIVIFTNGGDLYPSWWGFDRDETASNNGIALQACLDSSPNGGNIYPMFGIYSCSEVYFPYDYINLYLNGVELNTGTSQEYQIKIENVDWCGIHGGYLNGSVSTANIYVDTNAGDLKNLVIENLRIKGGATSGVGTPGYGILLDVSDADLSNCEFKNMHITHIRTGIYIKSTPPSNWAIDNSIFSDLIIWPYGADSETPGYGIHIEGATSCIFNNIYAGLFEHDYSRTIYIQPRYPTGMRDNVFNVITTDITDQDYCNAVYVLTNDVTKPCYNNTFNVIKIYNVGAEQNTGNRAFRAVSTNGGIFRNNTINCVYTYKWVDTETSSEMISLGPFTYDNTITLCGNDPNISLTDFITDYGHGNIIVGRNYHNKFYPDHDYSDQGVSTRPCTIKWAVDELSTANGEIILRHDPGDPNNLNETTKYQLETNETIPSNVTLEVEPGAYIDGNATLTINGSFKGSIDSFASGFDVVFGSIPVSSNFNYGPDTASDDDYLVTISSPYNGYIEGMHFYFDANNPNTGACTVNFNSWGAKSIKILHDQDPGNNCIEDGSIIDLMYDGTNFQMMNPCAN